MLRTHANVEMLLPCPKLALPCLLLEGWGGARTCCLSSHASQNIEMLPPCPPSSSLALPLPRLAPLCRVLPCLALPCPALPCPALSRLIFVACTRAHVHVRTLFPRNIKPLPPCPTRVLPCPALPRLAPPCAVLLCRGLSWPDLTCPPLPIPACPSSCVSGGYAYFFPTGSFFEWVLKRGKTWVERLAELKQENET